MKTLNFKKIGLLFIMMIGFSISSQAQDTRIDVNQLPANAKNFIAKNFKNNAVSYVLQEEDFLSIDEYKVLFTDGTKIEFNRNGDWKEVSNKEKAIKTTFISKKITDYCEKSFPNTLVIKVEKSKWNYEIKLTNGLELVFDSNGNFLRIDD